MDSKDAGIALPSELLAASEANNHLAVELHKLLAKEQENVFFSPFSISTAMAMLFCGCKGDTAEEMRSALGYDVAKLENTHIKSCFELLLKTMEGDKDGYTLSYANSVLIEKQFPVKKKYISMVKESFNALIQEFDGRQAVIECKKLNEWVKSKTNGMITELLKEISSSAVMIILNAVYFKGFWLNQFDKKNTKTEKFYNKGVKSNGKNVQMMHQKGSFPYLQEESFQALQLPYKGKEISMLILLPKAINGLNELENSLTPSFIRNIQQKMYNREVKVTFPKFRMEYSQALNGHFKGLGTNKIFNVGADFGGINDSKALLIELIMHKAVIEVNEEGAEASAATAVVMGLRSVSAPRIVPEFTADHPFLFVIYDCKSNIIYFMGRVDEL